jgi:diguanylate cyclase (GGDEF)-like protein
MPIDSFTVLLFGLFIKLVLGALFAVFWLKTRAAPWFGWWSASLLLGAIISALYMWRGTESVISLGLGNAALVASFACCWQGARTFDRRRPLWIAVLALPALWLAACLVPAFMASIPYRIVLSSGLVAPLLAMAAVEFWRGRGEHLPSRWPIIVILASFALFFAARIPLIGVAPFPFGALPMEHGWVGAFNLLMFAHTILLSVLFVSLSKERLELDQRTKAQTDPLTGALNRRAFIGRGERLLQRHAHERAPLCLVFLDLDHFKSLNDRFGHSGGDDVLMRFVGLLNASIRPTDFLFRIGGEEFCCLLPYTTTEQAHRVAERIRHQFEMTTVDIAGSPVKATTSLGIASTEAFGYELDTLMRRADMAVYAAKRSGRNRVMVANPGDEMPAAGDEASSESGTPVAGYKIKVAI